MTLLRWWLEHQQATTVGPAAVLRGSQLTARWIPSRRPNDLDFMLRGAWTLASVAAALRVAPVPGETTLDGVHVWAEGIWLDTPWPGLRVLLSRGAEKLQVDYGWGDPVATVPGGTTLDGVRLEAVTPEQMFAWKTHSLVEHGPRGRWHPKTLADLVLIARHVKLDDVAARACTIEAFESHGMQTTALDVFFADATWGSGRSSRAKWKKYVSGAPWVTFTMPEAIAEARVAVARVLQRQ